jgi:hypothetical protein
MNESLDDLIHDFCGRPRRHRIRRFIRSIIDFFTGESARKECEGMSVEQILETRSPTVRALDETPNDHDWPEDSTHENGDYECSCCSCGAKFYRHKRRNVCRKCTPDNGLHVAFYIAGLQVGERVIETEPSNCMHDMTGVVYTNADGIRCVRWDNGLGTSITWGTRRITEVI